MISTGASSDGRWQYHNSLSARACFLAIAVYFAAAITAAPVEPGSSNPSDAATTVGGVLVPAGVVYKPASQQANEAAREKLQRLFSFNGPAEEITGLIGATPTIIGAALWQNLLLQNPDIREKLNTPKVQLMVPNLDENGNTEHMQKMEATVIRTSAEAVTFWQELEKLIRKSADSSTSPTVRKLTAQELSLYWTMIPFDIEEPIFIVEVGDHHILVNAPAKQKGAIWIEDLKHLELRPDEDEKKTTASRILDGIPTPYTDPTTGQEMIAAWEESKPETGFADNHSSEGKATLNHIRLLTPTNVVEKNISVKDVTEIKDWVDACLEKLAVQPPAEHRFVVVAVFSEDANPTYRIAAEPALSDEDSARLRQLLEQGPKIKSQKEAVEISFAFLLGK